MKKKASIGKDNYILMFFAFAMGLILSNLLAESRMKTEKPVDKGLFVYKGIDKSKEDLSFDLQAQLSLIEIKRTELLERAAIEQHVYQYAYAEGISANDAVKKLFLVTEPSEEKVSQFYQLNSKEIDKPFFQVKDQIKKQLRQQQRVQRKNDVLVQLIESGDLHFL